MLILAILLNFKCWSLIYKYPFITYGIDSPVIGDYFH